MFRELISHARLEFNNVEWDVFLPLDYEWPSSDGVRPIRVNIRSGCLPARLTADHFQVPRAAERRGCKALVTVGFLPTLTRIPTIVHVLTLHHLDRENRTGWLRSHYRRWQVNKALDRAGLVITNSQVAANELIDIDATVRDRLLISSEGVEHKQFHPEAPDGEAEQIAERYSVGPGYLLWLSNFYPYKQLDLFLQAYAGLTTAEREEHPAVLVGGDWRGSRAEAERLAERLGITRDVHFVGWVSDRWIAPLFRHAALHVLASRAESFGRSVLEAMACGTPCVVNDIPVLREVTAGYAIFTDFANAECATAALRRGIADTVCRAELRRHGIQHSGQFTMKKLARERVAAIVERFG